VRPAAAATLSAPTQINVPAKQKDRPKAVSLLHRIKMVHRDQSKSNRYLISDLGWIVGIFPSHLQTAGYCRTPAAAIHPILAIQTILVRTVPESAGDVV
jgi:hypothetical protein